LGTLQTAADELGIASEGLSEEGKYCCGTADEKLAERN
jgi:hypothetical protein